MGIHLIFLSSSLYSSTILIVPNISPSSTNTNTPYKKAAPGISNNNRGTCRKGTTARVTPHIPGAYDKVGDDLVDAQEGGAEDESVNVGLVGGGFGSEVV